MTRVTLSFDITIKDGALNAERLVDACEQVAVILGVKDGYIAPGARISLVKKTKQRRTQNDNQ